MRQELDEKLCADYPEMFVNRDADMMTTAMCWGFSCGDGWYNILNNLCNNIQHHINWKEKQHHAAIKYNEMASQVKDGNLELFEAEYAGLSPSFKEDRLAAILEDDLRTVPGPVPQVILQQVKEKFGTLRFYYEGGDEYIAGLVSMAESMSGCTCEDCGNVGQRTGGGWIKTICQPCETQRKHRYAVEQAEYQKTKETKNEIKYQFIGEDTGSHD